MLQLPCMKDLHGLCQLDCGNNSHRGRPVGFGQWLGLSNVRSRCQGRVEEQSSCIWCFLPDTNKCCPSACAQGHPEPAVVSVCLVTVSCYLGIWIYFLPDPCKILACAVFCGEQICSLARYCMKNYNPMEQCNSADCSY